MGVFLQYSLDSLSPDTMSSAATEGNRRRTLDNLFYLDAALSIATGLLLVLTPHRFLLAVTSATGYSHHTHEVLRLYGCLRIAVGWILLKIRSVDDGQFRRGVTEALGLCYALQSLVVLRAQLTADTGAGRMINWLAFLVLSGIGAGYGTFRFGKGGKLIKVYELPTSGGRAQR